jgi:hypothetical protein
MDSHSEQQPPQNPEQEPKDPRIPKVIQELSESARFLKDPRLLSLQSSQEKPVRQILYSPSADKKFTMTTFHYDLERFAHSNLPEQLKVHERIIPANLLHFSDQPVGDLRGGVTTVWITLDKNDPKIFELLLDNGQPYHGGIEKLTGTEKAIERPKLLPFILDAVSGKKRIVYTNDEKSEWQNTFPPNKDTK